MANKDIAINIKATGIEPTVNGFKKVGDEASSMGRKVGSVTRDSAANMARMEKAMGNTATATGASAGIIGRSMEQIAGYVKKAAAAFFTFKMTQQIQEAVMFAANVEQADRALSVIANTMGRTSAEAMTYRNSLRDLGITTNSATNATAQFMKAGLPLDGLNKLGRAAQGAAISYQMMTGETISSSAALDKMIRALVTGNVTELHTLGINVMMRDTLRENKLATGEASTAVDTHKRHLLMFNDVLEKTEPLMLLYEKSMDLAAKQISSSKRPIEELALAFGNLFLPELTIAATQFYSTVSGGAKWVKSHGEELEVTKSVILALSEAMYAAAKIGATYLLIFKGIPAATAVWGWVTAKTALVAAEYQAQRAVASGTAVMLGSAEAAAMKARATVAERAATVALTAEELRRAQVMHAGILVEREAAVAMLAGARSVRWQNLALTELAAISKAAAVSQEQLALAEKAAITATNAHTASLNALDVAAHKARLSMISLSNVTNVMMALWIGWEVGKWASDNFEIARKAGVYMVHGLIKGWDLASEAYERFAATVNPFGDEEKQQAQLQAITAKYAAIKKTRDEALAGSLAETVTGSKATAKTYQEDPKTTAAGVAAEAERLKKEREQAARATSEAAEKEADQAYKQYTSTLDGFNKQIRHNNPYLDDHEEKLTDIDVAVRKAIEVTPQYEKSLRAAGEAIKTNIGLSRDMKDAIAATSQEFQRYLADWETQPSQGNNAGEMNLRWEEELKVLKSLQPSAAADALNEQIAMFERLLSDIPEKSDAVAAAIAKLKAEFSASSGLDSLLQGNADLRDQIAVDSASPWEQETLAAEKSYGRQMELEQAKLAAMKQGSDLEVAQLERMRLLEEDYVQWSAKAEQDRWKSNATAAADAMGQIGEVLMQGNRDQFEAGKAMMMGQAVIAAALAIIQSYAQLGPIGGSFAAIGVGVATLAQISAIEATEYQPRALGGPVVAGGSYLVGEQGPELIRMGSAGTVIPNNALAMAGEAQLKATKENTKAIARLAENFNDVAGSFKDLVLLATNNGLVSSRIAGVGTEEKKDSYWDFAVNAMNAGGKGTLGLIQSIGSGRFFETLFGEVKNAIQNIVDMSLFGLGGSVFGGKRSVTGAGLQLGYGQNGIEASQYTETKKSGGWFHGDKTTTNFSAIDSALMDSFNVVADNIAHSVSIAGEALGGLTVDLSSVSFAASKLDLRGMSEEQANKTIEDWFGKLAVAMAANIGGPEAQSQLAAATRFGETYYEALMRVTMALQSVNEAATTTGNQLMSVAQDVAIANADLASSLVDSFGGLSKFTDAIDKYNKVVNSDEAYSALKLAAAHREIASALSDQVTSVPDTIAEYRALVEATDMTSPLYRTLIGLTDAFGTIGDAAQTTISQINQLRDTILNLQTSDPTLSPESRYNITSTQFSSNAAVAATGDATAISALSSSYTEFLEASRGYYASSLGYQQDLQSATNTMYWVADTLALSNGLDPISPPAVTGSYSGAATLMGVDGSESLSTSALDLLPKFAAGGSYPGGAALMGERGPEFVDSSPGYVYRADETQKLFSLVNRGAGGDVNGALLAEFRSLRAEIVELRRSMGSEIVELRKEVAKYGDATVRVSQVGLKRVAEATESQVDSMKVMAGKARRAAAE